MELTFSWLYGASQAQQCDLCKVPHPADNPWDKIWCSGRVDEDRKLRAVYQDGTHASSTSFIGIPR